MCEANTVSSIIVDINYDEKLFDISYFFDILKPGGHFFPMFLIKEYHGQTCEIENIGFEIRDMINYLNEKENILIPVCRKPLALKPIIKNVLKYETGGINIDECRIIYKSKQDKPSSDWL